MRDPAHAALVRLVALQFAQNVYGNGKHDRRSAIAGDVVQSGEVAQLHGVGRRSEDVAGFHEFPCGLLLAFGVDDLGAPKPLGFGLLGYRAHHALVDVDMLDFDIRDFDSPLVGL